MFFDCFGLWNSYCNSVVWYYCVLAVCVVMNCLFCFLSDLISIVVWGCMLLLFSSFGRLWWFIVDYCLLLVLVLIAFFGGVT